MFRMEVDLVERAGLIRSFDHRINQTLKDDIDNLPPAGRLYPKFYIKVLKIVYFSIKTAKSAVKNSCLL